MGKSARFWVAMEPEGGLNNDRVMQNIFLEYQVMKKTAHVEFREGSLEKYSLCFARFLSA